MTRFRISLFGVAFVCLVPLGAANAQVAPYAPQVPGIPNIPGVQTITGAATRPRPDYDPIGVPLGSFLLYPNMITAVSYDDNVLRTDTGPLGDAFFTVEPQLTLESNWSRHFLELQALTTATQYASDTTENTLDFSLTGRGRLDVLRDLNVNFGGSYSGLHEPRGAPNLPGNAADPTRYRLGNANTSLVWQPSEFGVILAGSYNRYDFSETRLIGLPPISNSDRNENVFQGLAEAFYEFSPGYAAFVRVTDNSTDYDQHSDRNGFFRDSSGNAAVGGVRFNLTDLLVGEAFLGYETQHYNAPLPDIGGLDFGGELLWYPTERITVRVDGGRDILDTTLFGAAGGDDRGVLAHVDYEIYHNIIAGLEASYSDTDYKGTTRDDRVTGLTGTLDYLITRNVSVEGRYDYTTRDSTAAGQGFDDNTFTLGLKLQI